MTESTYNTAAGGAKIENGADGKGKYSNLSPPDPAAIREAMYQDAQQARVMLDARLSRRTGGLFIERLEARALPVIAVLSIEDVVAVQELVRRGELDLVELYTRDPVDTLKSQFAALSLGIAATGVSDSNTLAVVNFVQGTGEAIWSWLRPLTNIASLGIAQLQREATLALMQSAFGADGFDETKLVTNLNDRAAANLSAWSRGVIASMAGAALNSAAREVFQQLGGDFGKLKKSLAAAGVAEEGGVRTVFDVTAE